MDANSHSLPLPAGLSGSLDALVLEAIPRVDSAGQKLELAWGRFGDDLIRLVAALGIQAGRREDVLQDVYLTAREKCPAALCDEGLRRWLFRVTANRCRLEHRRRQRWGKVFAALTFWRSDATSVASSARAEQRELTSQVETALTKLATVEREIIVLKYFGDFDSSQIGEMLSLPAATVRSHLAKARKQLAKELGEWK